MNIIAKGLLRGVGFVANVILDGMNGGDKEEREEEGNPVMYEMIRATYEQAEYEHEMAVFNQINGTDHIIAGPGKIGW